jgi:hypothetical protein
MFFIFWAFSAIALPEPILSLGLTFVGYTLYYLSKRYRLIGKLTKASAMGLTILSLVCFCVFDRFQLFPVYYDYSLPQQALLYELGNPDAFEIIFASGDSEQSHREEVWHYYDYEMSYHFKDGEYAYSEELVFPATEWVKTSYEPWGFNRYMGENYLWDDFTFQQSEDEQPGAMPSFKLEEVWPELIEGMNISLQYHDQLALGFDSVTGRLIYVNASAVLEERQ